MTHETVNCSLCGKPAPEHCSTLVCRACHKEESLEDCLKNRQGNSLRAAYGMVPVGLETAGECGKLKECGHCACYSDMDHDLPGCQWCKITDENTEFTHAIVALRSESDAARLQVSEAKADKELFEKRWNDTVEKLEESNRLTDEMAAHAARLRVCLMRYGCHCAGCPIGERTGDKCECGLSDNIDAVPGQSLKRFDPVPIDTCENYRRDGETEVRPRFCSSFEGNAKVHAPTCQFFRG